MSMATKMWMAGAVALAIAVPAVPALSADAHKLVSPQDIKWGKGPASLPAGSEAVVLYGDPGKEGLFAYRIRLPAGYRIPPHTHPKPEIVTVISGTVLVGLGETADKGKARVLTAGSLFAMEPGMAHYVFTDEEAVVQLNSSGPWGVTYVDPKDDPRKTASAK